MDQCQDRATAEQQHPLLHLSGSGRGIDYGWQSFLPELLRLSQQRRECFLRANALPELRRLSRWSERVRCAYRHQFPCAVRGYHRPDSRFWLVRRHQLRDWRHLRLEIQESRRLQRSTRMVERRWKMHLAFLDEMGEGAFLLRPAAAGLRRGRELFVPSDI